MRYIKLGASGLDVSPVAIGAMTYGEPDRGHPVWSLGEADSRPLIKRALDAGINFFDTANLYSLGSSEEILGRALLDYANRDDVVICTKVRHPMRPGPNGQGLSRKAIMAEIDHSLRRLGTDYVDVYMIHRLDNRTPIEETLEALNDVVKAGKARYLGASSMHACEFATLLHLQERHGWARFITMQHHYNLLAREEEREMLPLCAARGVGTTIWSPLARGRLARPWQAAATARSTSDAFADLLYTGLTADSDHAIIDAVGEAAAARGVSAPRSGSPGCAQPRSGRAAGRREFDRADRRRRSLARHRANRRRGRRAHRPLHAALRLPGRLRRRRARPHPCTDPRHDGLTGAAN